MFVKTALQTLLITLFYLEYVYGKPADLGSDPLSVCYSLKCPEDTTICGKRSEVSEVDRTKLVVQIKCFNENGIVLKSKNITEENPFGPDVYYKGSKFSAVLRIQPSFAESENTDDLEGGKEFHHLSISPKSSIGPKSEVEDLNNK